MAMTIEAKESAGLEAGIYEGLVVDITEEDGVYNGEATEQYKFWIDVDGLFKQDGVTPTQQWAYANRVLSPKSKLWKWIKNYTGQAPQIGGVVDIEAIFRNQRICFTVSINENGRSVVTDVNKPMSAAAAPTAKAAPGQGVEEKCDVEGCTAQYDHFTRKGRQLCADHTAEDL